MYISHMDQITGHKMNNPEASNVVKRILVGPEEGWQGWVMRSFTISENGHTPCHRHPWPHINYIISGTGVLFLDGKEHPVQAGSVAYVPDDAEHQFQNTGSDDFVIICIVPEEGDK